MVADSEHDLFGRDPYMERHPQAALLCRPTGEHAAASGSPVPGARWRWRGVRPPRSLDRRDLGLPGCSHPDQRARIQRASRRASEPDAPALSLQCSERYRRADGRRSAAGGARHPRSCWALSEHLGDLASAGGLVAAGARPPAESYLALEKVPLRPPFVARSAFEVGAMRPRSSLHSSCSRSSKTA